MYSIPPSGMASPALISTSFVPPTPNSSRDAVRMTVIARAGSPSANDGRRNVRYIFVFLPFFILIIAPFIML